MSDSFHLGQVGVCPLGLKTMVACKGSLDFTFVSAKVVKIQVIEILLRTRENSNVKCKKKLPAARIVDGVVKSIIVEKVIHTKFMAYRAGER